MSPKIYLPVSETLNLRFKGRFTRVSQINQIDIEYLYCKRNIITDFRRYPLELTHMFDLTAEASY